MCRRPSQNQSQSTFASVLVGSDATVDREREKESTRIIGAVACVLVASPHANGVSLGSAMILPLSTRDFDSSCSPVNRLEGSAWRPWPP